MVFLGDIADWGPDSETGRELLGSYLALANLDEKCRDSAYAWIRF